MPINNDNIDNDLDEQIDNLDLFNDFDTSEPQTGTRKPAGAAHVVTKNLLAATSAFTKTAATEVANSMPKTGGLVGEFLEVKDSLDDFRREFKENYAPTINEVKKAMYKSLPMAEKYIPRALYSKIENALKDYKDEVKKTQKTDAQRQSDFISSSIAEIFSAQEEIRTGERTEDRVNDIVEKVTEATRYEANKKLLTTVSNNLHYQSQFIKTTQTAWMKKMLELKYISVYTGREMLSTLKIQVSMLETKLEELKHNNAIPDWNKWTLPDYIGKIKKQYLVGKAMKSGINPDKYISSVAKGLVGTAKRGMKNVLGGIRSQASLAGTAADMQSMMPDDAEPGTGFGKAVGGLGGKFFGRSVADRLLPLIENIEDAANIQGTAAFKAKRLREKLEGKGSIAASMLAQFLPAPEESMDVENELLMEPTQPLPFDRATRQAIVEIIPQWLAKIAKNTKDTATGMDTEEEAYDVVTRRIVGKKQALLSAKEEVFGKAGARSQESMVAVGYVKAGLERNAPAKEAADIFKSREADVFKFINNSAIRSEIVYPDMIRKFAEGDEEAINSRYIRRTFEGIENPRAVAQLITMSLYKPDGKLDRKVLKRLEGAMVGASAAKTWRGRLPQMLEAHGAYGMFKESGILSEESVVSEKELSTMLSEVSPEKFREQVSTTAKSTVGELKLREDREKKLKEDSIIVWRTALSKLPLGRMRKKEMYSLIRELGKLGGVPDETIAERVREEQAQQRIHDERLGKVSSAVETGRLMDYTEAGSPMVEMYQTGEERRSGATETVGGRTKYIENFVDPSLLPKRSPYGALQAEGGLSGLSEIQNELKRFHRVKEKSDTEILAKIAEQYSGLSETRDELKRFHGTKEKSDEELLAKITEQYASTKVVNDKLIDAFTDTDQTTGALGQNDIFEIMQSDLETLTQTTVRTSVEMIQRLDDILAAAELSLDMAETRNLDLKRLTDITDRRMRKQVFGDTDQDFIREGSYADQLKDSRTKKMQLAYGIPGAAMFAGGAGGGDGGAGGGAPGPGGNAPGTPVSAGKLGWLPGAGLVAGGLTMGAKASGFLRGGINLARKGVGMTKWGQNLAQSKGLLGRVARGTSAYGKHGLRGLAKQGAKKVAVKAGQKVATKVAAKGGAKVLAKGAGRSLAKTLGPLAALAEVAYGGLSTGLDEEKAEAKLQSNLSREEAIAKNMGIFGQVGKYTGANQAIMALGLDKYGENWREKGVIGGTLSNVGESLDVFQNLGANIGAFGSTAVDTVQEFKGPDEYRQLLDALKSMDIVSDPIGWGDWKIKNWDGISSLSVRDLGLLYGQGDKHFSTEDLEQVKNIWKLKRKRQKQKEDKQKEEAKREADVAKMVKPVGEKPQSTVTTTDATGKTVAATYQAPPPPTEESVGKVDMAKQQIASQSGTVALEQQTKKLDEQHSTLKIIAEELSAINGNTGTLGDIKKDLGENLKAAKEPTVVVANTGDQSKRPKVHRQSIDIMQA